MLKKSILLLFLFLNYFVIAQNPLHLNFRFLNGSSTFSAVQAIQDLNGTYYKARDIAFYISKLKITHDGGQILDFQDSVFYVNKRASIFDLGLQNVDLVESIDFQVGVPASVNHSDISAYPENHPLYFQIPAMHWGWVAGYTFFLIDGDADNNGDNIMDVGFELHCLGDSNLQQVHVVNTATVWPDGTREIFQDVNIDQWLRNVNLSTLDIQHGSTGINADVMMNVQNYPVFTAPLNASINEINSLTGEVLFLQNGKESSITWKGMKNIEKVELFDLSGALINELFSKDINGKWQISNLISGVYLVRFTSESGQLLNQIKAVQP
jgi:hypothetical protein